VSDGPNEFDLSAAGIRRAQTDTKAFMEAFAVRMEGAIPDRVKVERHRDGLFSKLSHVASVSITLEQHVYVLVLDKAHLLAQRTRIVRGVTLKSEQLAVPVWLQDLQRDIAAMAEYAGAAQQVLHDFLMS